MAHAEGVLYSTELGSVTLKRVVFIFVFQLNTQHTEDYGWGVLVGRPFGARRRSSVRYGTRLGDLKENCFYFVFQLKSSTHTGVWDKDYWWGVRVGRPFGARRRSSVGYGTRLGDLKESWFILFSN